LSIIEIDPISSLNEMSKPAIISKLMEEKK